MAETLAKEWLKAASDDLDSIRYIVKVEHLSHIVAFHSQQAIEKSFKAILVNNGDDVSKKHDLFALHELVKRDFGNIDNEKLFRINDLYIDSRYPGDLGLLPHGKPSADDAQAFYDFALDIFERVCEHLGIDAKEIQYPSSHNLEP